MFLTDKGWKEIMLILEKYGTSLTMNPDDGHDLAMFTATKILETENLPSGVNLEAFALRTLNCRYKDNIKKQITESNYIKNNTPISSEANYHPFPVANEIFLRLMLLPEKCRRILILHGLGNSYKDISYILDESPDHNKIKTATIRKRMARCRKELDEELNYG